MDILILDNDGAWSLTHNHADDYYISHAISYIGCTDWEYNCSVILFFGLGAYIASWKCFSDLSIHWRLLLKVKISSIAG